MPSVTMTGLYHVYDGAEGLLYIGVSNDFGRRWQQHARKQPWWDERRRMTVDFYDDREEALDAEALAIFHEQPKHNVMHRKQAQRLVRLKRQAVTVPGPEAGKVTIYGPPCETYQEMADWITWMSLNS